MKADDLKKEMDKRGIQGGKWQPVGGDTFEPKFMKKQRDLLLKLKAMLEAKVAADTKLIDDLEIAKAKTLHGGGK